LRAETTVRFAPVRGEEPIGGAPSPLVSRERVPARDDLAADPAAAWRFRDDAVLERAD
jgi:hypothetical protein